MTELTAESEELLARVASDWDMDPYGEYESAKRRMEADLAAIEAAAVRRAAQPGRSASDGVGVERCAECGGKAWGHQYVKSHGFQPAALATHPPAPDGERVEDRIGAVIRLIDAVHDLCPDCRTREQNHGYPNGYSCPRHHDMLREAAEWSWSTPLPPTPAAAVSGEARWCGATSSGYYTCVLPPHPWDPDGHHYWPESWTTLALAAARDTGARGEGVG